MRQNYFRSTYKLMVLWVVIFCSNAGAAAPTLDTTDVPEYDYSQTDLIIFYGQNDYVALANPFQYPAPVMGALVYEIILLYATQLQIYPGLPEEPTHVIDLLMNDINGTSRLGQRVFVGDPWLSDGKSLALMKPEDYELLVKFLRERYEASEKYDVSRLKNLRRPKQSELPDNWQPEKPSLQTAIDHMESDYERSAYDPGAEIRRMRIENLDGADTSVEPNQSVIQNGEYARHPATAELQKTTGAMQHDTAPQIFPESTETDETVSANETTNEDEAEQQLLLALLMLLGLLFLTLIVRKKRKDSASRQP